MKYIKGYKIFENNTSFVNYKTFKLESWYDKLNKHFFNGKLPNVPLRWNQAEGELGVVKWEENSKNVDHLGISRSYKLTQAELLSVLAHEMIHIWQIENKKTDGHGKEFVKKMDEMNKKTKWGIRILPKQPMDHLKSNNPDLSKDYGFIMIKNKKDDFDIAVYDPKKTDYKKILIIIQQNIKKGNSVDVEVRLTKNGVIKKYENESTNGTLSSYSIDEVTFNTLMNDSKQIHGSNLTSHSE